MIKINFFIIFFKFVFQKNVKQDMLIECTIKRLKDEIALRDVLVLNNSSLLRVLYNKILSIHVLLKFSSLKVPYIFLNEYNFGMFKFVRGTKVENISNYVKYIEPTEPEHIENTFKLEYYNLKYVILVKFLLIISLSMLTIDLLSI